MGVPNQQIGWSVEAKLLQSISKALDRAIKVASHPTTTTTTTTVAPTTTTTTTGP